MDEPRATMPGSAESSRTLTLTLFSAVSCRVIPLLTLPLPLAAQEILSRQRRQRAPASSGASFTSQGISRKGLPKRSAGSAASGHCTQRFCTGIASVSRGPGVHVLLCNAFFFTSTEGALTSASPGVCPLRRRTSTPSLCHAAAGRRAATPSREHTGLR